MASNTNCTTQKCSLTTWVLGGLSVGLSLYALQQVACSKRGGGCCAKKAAKSCGCGSDCSCCAACSSGGVCTCGDNCKCCGNCGKAKSGGCCGGKKQEEASSSSSSRKIIQNKLPGKPYSLAQVHNGTVYVSGQVGLGADGKLVEGGFRAQAKQVMDNIKAALEQAGSSFDKSLKLTCYLANMSDYAEFNAVYLEYFPNKDALPTRVCVTATIPLGALVEVDCIATL
eukprot:c195_g1_i1.p1 GENE.c195_g1_i1~~c195_g1_i1.p1  ORF type:complete len:250 (-),score=61.93 c195_g1_i1:134-814(-)